MIEPYKSWAWRFQGTPSIAERWEARRRDDEEMSAWIDDTNECHQTKAHWLEGVNELIDIDLDRERLLSYIQD